MPLRGVEVYKVRCKPKGRGRSARDVLWMVNLLHDIYESLYVLVSFWLCFVRVNLVWRTAEGDVKLGFQEWQFWLRFVWRFSTLIKRCSRIGQVRIQTGIRNLLFAGRLPNARLAVCVLLDVFDSESKINFVATSSFPPSWTPALHTPTPSSFSEEHQ